MQKFQTLLVENHWVKHVQKISKNTKTSVYFWSISVCDEMCIWLRWKIISTYKGVTKIYWLNPKRNICLPLVVVFLINLVFFGILWRIQRVHHSWNQCWSWILGMRYRTVSNYSHISGAFWKRHPRGWEFISRRNHKLQGAKGASKEDVRPQSF